MGIKPRFTKEDIRKAIRTDWARIERGILDIISYVGEEFVLNVRNGIAIDAGAYPKGDYMDDTGNLRGSVAYFILKDGMVVKANAEGSSEGQSAAQAMLNEVTKLKSGYQLIGVAGMEYASYLEAMGYNVITSQSELALIDLEKQIKAYAKRKGVGFDTDYTGVMVQML